MAAPAGDSWLVHPSFNVCQQKRYEVEEECALDGLREVKGVEEGGDDAPHTYRAILGINGFSDLSENRICSDQLGPNSHLGRVGRAG